MNSGVIMAGLYIAGGIIYIAHCFWELHELDKRISKMEADPFIQKIRAERKAERIFKQKGVSGCRHEHTSRYDSLYDNAQSAARYSSILIYLTDAELSYARACQVQRESRQWGLGGRMAL